MWSVTNYHNGECCQYYLSIEHSCTGITALFLHGWDDDPLILLVVVALSGVEACKAIESTKSIQVVVQHNYAHVTPMEVHGGNLWERIINNGA